MSEAAHLAPPGASAAAAPSVPVSDLLALARALRGGKQPDGAVAVWELVRKHHPEDGTACFELAKAAFERGDLRRALGLIDVAQRTLADDPNVLQAAGIMWRRAGDLDKAIGFYRRGLEIAPNMAELHFNLGNALSAKRDHAAAMTSFELAANLRPDFHAALNGLASACAAAGDRERAHRIYERAVERGTTLTALLLNYGNLLHEERRYEEAIAIYNRIAQPERESPTVATNLGAALRGAARYAEARQVYEKALAVDPKSVGLHYNLGNLLKDQGLLKEAIRHFEEAMRLDPKDPSPEWNRSLALLLSGDLETGFKAFESRWRYPGFPTKMRPYKQPLWDGSPLAGRTLVVWAEQGLGDTIQFFRYLPILVDRVAGSGRIVFECHEPLLPLFAGQAPGVEIVQRNAPLPEFDVHLPLLSLARIFGTTAKTVPRKVPYLALPPGADFALPDAPPEALRVGLVWAGNPQHGNDRNRSAPLAAFRPLLEMAGVQVFGLQKGAREDEPAREGLADRLVMLGPQFRSFIDTGAAIRRLDLVISVDTSVAHLAGALGAPVWLLLPFAPDWRWILGRSDSPWYPTMRIFRQPSPGAWEAVAADLQKALRALARSRRQR